MKKNVVTLITLALLPLATQVAGRVIVITAREDLAARATALQIGPVAYFMKPFNDEKFLAAVQKALAT